MKAGKSSCFYLSLKVIMFVSDNSVACFEVRKLIDPQSLSTRFKILKIVFYFRGIIVGGIGEMNSEFFWNILTLQEGIPR